MFEILITTIHIFVALFMILVVLVQGGNQGGVGAAFGGGNSSGVFGATGATTFLGKLTYGAAAIFMLTSITLTIMHGKSGILVWKNVYKRRRRLNPQRLLHRMPHPQLLSKKRPNLRMLNQLVFRRIDS